MVYGLASKHFGISSLCPFQLYQLSVAMIAWLSQETKVSALSAGGIAAKEA